MMEKHFFFVHRLLLLITCGYGSFICKSIHPSKAQIDLCTSFFCAVEPFSFGDHHCDQNPMKQRTATAFYSMWQAKHEKHCISNFVFSCVSLCKSNNFFFDGSSQHKARQQLINGFFPCYLWLSLLNRFMMKTFSPVLLTFQMALHISSKRKTY